MELTGRIGIGAALEKENSEFKAALFRLKIDLRK